MSFVLLMSMWMEVVATASTVRVGSFDSSRVVQDFVLDEGKRH